MFHSVGVHKVYLFIHTNKWSATASTGNYVDFVTIIIIHLSLHSLYLQSVWPVRDFLWILLP